MFFTERLMQRTMFDGDDYLSPSTISQLIKFAQEAFPEADCNLHRQIAFVTHRATQNFLGPLLKLGYGSINEAKEPTMKWLDDLGSLETFARSTRKQDGECKPAKLQIRKTPDWYSRYCRTDRYLEMKQRAIVHWTGYMNGLTCSWNARHSFEVMHHRDYARLGEADEFRFLVPLCHGCHQAMNARGPNVPACVPEAVKKWL